MARSLHKLTARSVAAAKRGRHSDGGGLYLVVSDAGAAKWVFRFTLAGSTSDLGLGSSRDVSLAEARTVAARYRSMVAHGESPKTEHRKESVPTFGEFADAYIETMRPSWRNAKHGAQWAMTLKEYAAPLRGQLVSAIQTSDILGVLKPVWQTKPETASRLRGRIETVLDAAKAKGFRTGENPARWRGHLDKLLPARQRLTRGHHAAVAFDNVPSLVADLHARQATAARALEFLILTAARSGEVIGARWNEIDLTKSLWTVPADRMKAGREHRVPLPPRAVAILQQLKPVAGGSSDLVFPGPRKDKPLSDMAMAMLLNRRMKVDATVHGFRSAFRDWAGERTNFPRDVAEAALAHTLSDKTEAAYRRGDALEKRRKLMDAWASFIEPPKSAKVIALRPKAS